MEDKRADIAFGQLEDSLKKVWRKYHNYIVPGGSDLSPVQFYLLKFLNSRGTSTPSEVAGEFGITLGAVTGLIDRLLKTGLILRGRSEEDRRLVLISLTDGGKALIEIFERERAGKVSRLAERFGAADINTLAALLNRLEVVLDQMAGK
jgi:DNA-binding MarR family transcriptional regulator